MSLGSVVYVITTWIWNDRPAATVRRELRRVSVAGDEVPGAGAEAAVGERTELGFQVAARISAQHGDVFGRAVVVRVERPRNERKPAVQPASAFGLTADFTLTPNAMLPDSARKPAAATSPSIGDIARGIGHRVEVWIGAAAAWAQEPRARSSRFVDVGSRPLLAVFTQLGLGLGLGLAPAAWAPAAGTTATDSASADIPTHHRAHIRPPPEVCDRS